mmetsp:Transcript_70670/g.163372  ORF Transcript_70670/g.163372 Transcript_70670/m.163372 type:complete len:222 (-) Transcript_70670:126-791(-)
MLEDIGETSVSHKSVARQAVSWMACRQRVCEAPEPLSAESRACLSASRANPYIAQPGPHSEGSASEPQVPVRAIKRVFSRSLAPTLEGSNAPSPVNLRAKRPFIFSPWMRHSSPRRPLSRMMATGSEAEESLSLPLEGGTPSPSWPPGTLAPEMPDSDSSASSGTASAGAAKASRAKVKQGACASNCCASSCKFSTNSRGGILSKPLLPWLSSTAMPSWAS